jgi:hypothetical protein
MKSNLLKKSFISLVGKIKKINYKKYYLDNNLDKILKVKQFKKIEFEPNYIIDNFNKKYEPQILDLIRLHFITKYMKSMTILELGCGNSTLFLSDALKHNKKKFLTYIEKNLRKKNLFEIHSVDSNYKYIKLTKKKLKKKNLDNFAKITYSTSNITKYLGNITSEFRKLPDISPDFIYIDGPHRKDVLGEVDGISFKNDDRPLTSCDILKIENLLIPGTLILIDGLTNYSLFLKNNLKRNWAYKRLEKEDISLFQLCDHSLGYLNDRYIKFITEK